MLLQLAQHLLSRRESEVHLGVLNIVLKREETTPKVVRNRASHPTMNILPQVHIITFPMKTTSSLMSTTHQGAGRPASLQILHLGKAQMRLLETEAHVEVLCNLPSEGAITAEAQLGGNRVVAGHRISWNAARKGTIQRWDIVR